MRLREPGRKFNTVKNTAALFSNRKNLLQMIADMMQGRYKMSPVTSLLLLAGTAYIILPFDFDWIPLIGWVDDGFVGYWIVKQLLSETKRYIHIRQQQAKQR